MPVDIAGAFHRDELLIRDRSDVFHHSIDRQTGSLCDGAILWKEFEDVGEELLLRPGSPDGRRFGAYP